MGNKRAPCPAPGRQRTRRKKCRIWKTLLRLLADVSQDAAVNVQDEAVDEVGSGRSQEDSGSAQILSLAPAACGGLGDDEAVEGMTAAVGLTLAQRCGLRGSDVAGSDAVALDYNLSENRRLIGIIMAHNLTYTRYGDYYIMKIAIRC